MFVAASPWVCARMELHAGPSFNVIDYGAIGNGQTDDSPVCLSFFFFLYIHTTLLPTHAYSNNISNYFNYYDQFSSEIWDIMPNYYYF